MSKVEIEILRKLQKENSYYPAKFKCEFPSTQANNSYEERKMTPRRDTRNYFLLLTRLLAKRKWKSVILWKMIDTIVQELIQIDDDILFIEVFKEIYRYAKICESLIELENFIDTYTYTY